MLYARHFAPENLMHELHASLFRSLLSPRCPHCGEEEIPMCSEGTALDSKGYSIRPDSPTAVVAWPRCPHTSLHPRSFGTEALYLSDHVEYAYECHAHMNPDLSAGGHQLIREWIKCRETPKILRENKALEEHRRTS